MGKRIIRSLLSAAICCAVLLGTAQAACIGGATTTDNLRLRSGASTGSTSYYTVPAGSAVIVNADAGNGWYQVNHAGTSGYMYAQYLSYSESLSVSATTGYINGTGVRLRSGPGTDSAILGVFTHGDAVSITGVCGAWYTVSRGGRTGYVHSSYVVYSIDALRSLSAGQDVVDKAEEYLRYSYVWGGSSPSTGFDCSGFVKYVFESLGYTINYRTAADIYAYNGTDVAYDDLRAGDALFFSSSSNWVGHTGIYIGDGEFIHASSGCGYVTISSLTESYYARNYVGAKRIV